MLSNIYGLAFACPALKNFTDCPFNDLRKLPYHDRVEQINKMTDTEKEELLQVHYNHSNKLQLMAHEQKTSLDQKSQIQT